MKIFSKINKICCTIIRHVRVCMYLVWKSIILLVEYHGTNFTFSKSPFQKSEVHTTKKTRTLQLQRTSWSGLDLQIAFRESSKLLPPRRSYSDSTHCWHDKFNFEIYFYAGVARRKCIMFICTAIRILERLGIQTSSSFVKIW